MNRKSQHLTQQELKQQVEQNKGWYFITFVGNLPHERPYTFTLYSEPFILLRNKSGQLSCYMLIVNQEKIDNPSIQTFPVVEKHGCIWFWYHKNTAADPELIPTVEKD